MKTLELESGLFELNRFDLTSINGGDSNGTMAGEKLDFNWTLPIINFVAGVFGGIFS